MTYKAVTYADDMLGKDCDQVFGPDLMLTIDRASMIDGDDPRSLVQGVNGGKLMARSAQADGARVLAVGVWSARDRGGDFFIFSSCLRLGVFFAQPSP